MIKNQGCRDPYSGKNIQINSLTGEVTANQNVSDGYNETICIRCENAAGSFVTQDIWKIEQLSDCALATANLKPVIETPKSSIGKVGKEILNKVTPKFTFDYIYWSGDETLDDVRYAKVNIAPMKELFVMSKSHCSS